MQTTIQRWGNSLGVRIPRGVALEAQVEPGTVVDVTVKDGEISVKAVSRKRYSLAILLGEVTRANQHAEVATSAPVGREVW